MVVLRVAAIAAEEVDAADAVVAAGTMAEVEAGADTAAMAAEAAAGTRIRRPVGI
jgi:hypothetical protein